MNNFIHKGTNNKLHKTTSVSEKIYLRDRNLQKLYRGNFNRIYTPARTL